jgi:hypothetical protein
MMSTDYSVRVDEMPVCPWSWSLLAAQQNRANVPSVASTDHVAQAEMTNVEWVNSGTHAAAPAPSKIDKT